VLWLVAKQESIQRNLRHEAQARGVDPDRLVFAKPVPYPEHLARISLADLFLDNLPFNGGTTTSDALWAGVPVVTCAGEAFAARMSGSLLRAVGLPELITHTLADYEALALRIGTTPDLLRQLQDKLRAQHHQSALFDTHRFTRHLESAYQTMWQRHQQGLQPHCFAVRCID
jgi:predicted O-linked N-acetylglucosamine transferase (SPINDLY family)